MACFLFHNWVVRDEAEWNTWTSEFGEWTAEIEENKLLRESFPELADVSVIALTVPVTYYLPFADGPANRYCIDCGKLDLTLEKLIWKSAPAAVKKLETEAKARADLAIAKKKLDVFVQMSRKAQPRD